MFRTNLAQIVRINCSMSFIQMTTTPFTRKAKSSPEMLHDIEGAFGGLVGGGDLDRHIHSNLFHRVLLASKFAAKARKNPDMNPACVT